MVTDLDFVLKIGRYISRDCRFPLSKNHLAVRDFLKVSLSEVFEDVNRQRFEFALKKPVEGKVFHLDEHKGLPYTNSPSGVVEGVVVDCGYGLPKEVSPAVRGNIALVREGKKTFREKERLLHRLGAKAVITFREEINEIYSGVSAGLLPTLSVKREDGILLVGKAIRLFVKTEEIKGEGENVWVEWGRGRRVLTLVAHYDTKPETNGAIDNGFSVAILLWLALKLRSEGFFPKTYRLRILFTDLEEFGLLGAQRFVQSLPSAEFSNSLVAAVDTVGWHNPAILCRDAAGFNDRYSIAVVERILKHLGMRKHFFFTEGKSGRSDHIPFKKRGAKTLFFTSNPFPFRHTSLDTADIVSVENVRRWMGFLKTFATAFFKFPPS